MRSQVCAYMHQWKTICREYGRVDMQIRRQIATTVHDQQVVVHKVLPPSLFPLFPAGQAKPVGRMILSAWKGLNCPTLRQCRPVGASRGEALCCHTLLLCCDSMSTLKQAGYLSPSQVPALRAQLRSWTVDPVLSGNTFLDN
jgi:hypothetical protein